MKSSVYNNPDFDEIQVCENATPSILTRLSSMQFFVVYFIKQKVHLMIQT